jgi:hypothetical protein
MRHFIVKIMKFQDLIPVNEQAYSTMRGPGNDQPPFGYVIDPAVIGSRIQIFEDSNLKDIVYGDVVFDVFHEILTDTHVSLLYHPTPLKINIDRSGTGG